MNVTDLNATSNPVSENLQSARRTLEDIDVAVSKLKQLVHEAAGAGASFDSVERRVRDAVSRLGKQALDLLLQLQGDGDLGPEVAAAEGVALKRQQPVTTTVRSIFGVHQFQQYTYARGPKKKVELRPVSARLSLPERQWSYLLQEMSQTLSVDSAYEQAMENLGTILGTKFSVDTAEQINGQMGNAASDFLDKLPIPSPQSEGKLLVASADCKGVPLVKQEAARVAAFEQAKKRPGNRRMATVASVYSVDPHVRSAEDVTAAMFREEPGEDAVKATRPRPQNKNTTAHFPELAEEGTDDELPIGGIHVAMAWIVGQLIARRRQGQVLVVLMDGQQSLWETFQLHLSFSAKTIPILDVLHALSYLWEAAGLFEKDQTRRKAFTRCRCLRMLRGEVRAVIRGLRRQGTIRRLRGQDAKDLARICSYLEKNADRMQYDQYLRRGYPIASGVIEGACRHLVKDRMERSGMRWTLEGARNMLDVRAAFQSDHWRTFLDHRMETEVQRTHPNKHLIAGYQPLTLSC